MAQRVEHHLRQAGRIDQLGRGLVDQPSLGGPPVRLRDDHLIVQIGAVERRLLLLLPGLQLPQREGHGIRDVHCAEAGFRCFDSVCDRKNLK